MSAWGRVGVVLGWILLGVLPLQAQVKAKVPAQGGSAAEAMVMLSDIHFDPFHDPAKVALLLAAPVEQWEGILREPDSPDQASRFAALQKTCSARGIDTPYALLGSALEAAHAEAKDARFVAVPGDLLVHGFDCRFKAVLGDQINYREFAEKTFIYVVRRLQAGFPGVPVYVGLGNNDSSCGHNEMDVNDHFLRATAADVVAGFRGARAAEVRQASADYQIAGFYSMPFGAALPRTRMLVLNDSYMATHYANCAGQPDDRGAKLQLAWLDKELAAAHAHGEKVWVMAHLPTGVDPYATFARAKSLDQLCTGTKPEMFLVTEGLSEVLLRHADVVRLALFAHTHMDEFRVLQNPGGGDSVPVKFSSSISPVDGNAPSFTVGRVGSPSATLEDYTVYTGSNETGVATVWSREYGFDQTYGVKSFSPAVLAGLVSRMQADPQGDTEAGKAYRKAYFAGFEPSPLDPVWRQYGCALNHTTSEAFHNCVCVNDAGQPR